MGMSPVLQNLKHSSVKWKISIVTIIVLLTIMISVSFIISTFTENVIKEQVNNQIKILTKSQKKILNNQISRLKRDINQMTENFIYKDYIEFAASSYNDIPKNKEDVQIGIITEKYEESRHAFNELLRSVSPSIGTELKYSLKKIEYAKYASLVMPNGIVMADSRMGRGSNIKYFNDYIGREIHDNIYLSKKIETFQYIKGKSDLFFITELIEKEKLIGYLIIALSNNIITNTLETSLGEFGHISLINKEGIILNHKNKGLIGNSIENRWFVKNIKKDVSFKEEKAGDYYYIFNQIKGENLYLAASIPYSNIMQSANNIRNIILLISVIGILIMFIIVYLISNWQLKPLEKLLDKIKKVKKGDLDVQIEVSADDEIGTLASNFNDMIDNVNELMNKIKEDHQEIRKMELKALQAQINPHFLYNTLDTIYWMIRSGEYKMSSETTVALSEFFRLSLNKGKDIITIEKEIEHIKKYIFIQKMRYPDKFDCNIDIDHDIKNRKCIKLILQPLVENAFVHGLKGIKKGGIINITGREKDDIIMLSVCDNGNGFNVKNQNKLIRQDITNRNDDSGYALKNIDRRIKLYYGDRYGIIITNSKMGGACVEIHLPSRPLEDISKKGD